jgi:hypothetical protein
MGLFVEGPRGGAAYAAPATVTATSVEADLGPLGHIALDLNQSGAQRTAHSRCDHHTVRYEGGTWVGEFAFRGEHGYTTAEATSLPYRLEPLLDLLCSGVGYSHTGGDQVAGAGLDVGASNDGRRVKLSAHTNGPGKAVEVSASIHEQHGEVEIDRFVADRFPASVFSYDSDLAWATLEPTAPFSGRAVFRRAAARSNRWTGNLTIDFPGRSGVSVTGSRFRSALRRGEWQTEGSHQHARIAGPTLPRWPSTKRSPIASARSSPPGRR